MLKAISFDLWETLITDTPELARQQERLRLDRLEAALRSRGRGDVADRIEHAYRALWSRCHDLYWSADRDVPCRTQIEHFLEALELEPSAFGEDALSELEHVYAHAALDVLPAVVDGAPDLLRELDERGLGIGLISNTGRTPGYVLRRVLEKLGLARWIDVMVFSNEHGECKPRRSIFDALRRGLGIDFDEMLFVGDNLYADVHGAQSCGMRAIHFDPPVRGHAVAPPIDHGLEIVADATISSLRELPRLVERFSAPREEVLASRARR